MGERATALAERTAGEEPDASGSRREPVTSSPVRWAMGAVLMTVAVQLVILLWRTGGTFVYVLDDPAIHLTVARRLIFHGTWGVVPGEFQSASSSPLWTLVLAPTQWVFRGKAGEVAPLVLNLVAAWWVLRLLAPDLTRFRSSLGRAGTPAVVFVAVVLLFLPGLAFVGMEHTLHMALVLALVLATESFLVRKPPDGGDFRTKNWVAAVVLVFLATLTRGETAFVVAGLVLAVLWLGVGSLRRRISIGAGLVASCLTAFGVVAAVNLAYGQEILPNSVVLKTLGDRGETGRTLDVAWERLSTDPLLVVLLIVALAVVVDGVRRRSGQAYLFPAVAFMVATLLHVDLAAVAQDVRYQAYLLGLGVLVLLRVVPAALERRPVRPGWWAPGLVLLVLVAGSTLQLKRTATAPWRAEGMYEQRYQVAQFLHQAYDHEPIAIGELGYIALYHDGPLTDVYGLADHEVLQARMDHDHDNAFWHALQERRGFRLLVAYNFTTTGDEMQGWYRVGMWRSPDLYYPVTEFWATTPEEVQPLLDRLHAFESELADNVEVTYNRLAPLAAHREIEARG